MDEELLFESENTRVTRVDLGAGVGMVIRKEPLGPEAIGRARHELSILRRLADVVGIPQVVVGPEYPEAILMEDVGGECLAATVRDGPMGIGELLGYALSLAAILKGIHGRGVVHWDVNPSNILIHSSPPQLMLIDFDLARTFTEKRPAADGAGTLAYMSPEQTGRTGRLVDQRTDLYSFGVTLYELATGVLPFGNGDPLQLTQDHLTRVPVPPRDINHQVPPGLSAVIMRLLEKEPDRRYQTAEGVLHDLRRLVDQADGTTSHLILGRWDFPSRLAPHGGLVGREAELTVLASTLAEVVAGSCRSVLVTGQPGVGKTVLVNELRPLVMAAGGWFLSGKFDQYRANASSDALRQILGTLARMLLALPEPDLALLRLRLLDLLGGNAGLLAAAVPQLRPVLDIVPNAENGDPATTRRRLHQSGLAFLCAVAGPSRPVVIFADDLQWADPASVDFIDTLLTTERLPGVMVVCSYRESEVNPQHPLWPTVCRWRGLAHGPARLRLGNLSTAAIRVLLGDMLRLPPTEVATLADFVEERTAGNPFNAVELINALRGDNTLTLGERGWSWDPQALSRHIGASDVMGGLAIRIAGLPPATRELLEIIACLGGTVDLDTLRLASGLSAAAPDARSEIDRRLAPAVAGGLLTMEREPIVTVRFSHDWIQQTAHNSMSDEGLSARHLAIARNLASIPTHAVAAAEQYLPVVTDLADRSERRRVIQLLRTAAGYAWLLANHALVEHYLATATRVLDLDPAEEPDAELRLELDLERHAALYALGRFNQVDTLYQRIRQTCDNPLVRAEAAWVQVSGLTNRGQPGEALDLGLDTLAELGSPAPEAADLAAEIDRGLDALTVWAASGDATEDLDPEQHRGSLRSGRRTHHQPDDPGSLLLPLAAVRLDDDRGTPACGKPADRTGHWSAHSRIAALVTIALREDYDTGHEVVRRVYSVGENRGYEPETSEARFLYAVSVGPWFEPLEESVRQARLARDGLIRGGDIQFAGYTYYASVTQLLDCAPTLDGALAEIDSGLAFAARTGNDFPRGESGGVSAGGAHPARRDRCPGQPERRDLRRDRPIWRRWRTTRPPASSTTSSVVWSPRSSETSPSGGRNTAGGASPADPRRCPALPHDVLRVSGLWSWRATIQAAAPPARGTEARRNWTEAESGWRGAPTPSPASYLHLRCLVDAERAWALGDAEGAFAAYDQAQTGGRVAAPAVASGVDRRTARPVPPRRSGIEYAGRTALREARRMYQDWGATGKVGSLTGSSRSSRGQRSRRGLGSARGVARIAAAVSSETVDMLAVLRASQALSSETNLVRLRERVTEVLRA